MLGTAAKTRKCWFTPLPVSRRFIYQRSDAAKMAKPLGITVHPSANLLGVKKQENEFGQTTPIYVLNRTLFYDTGYENVVT